MYLGPDCMIDFSPFVTLPELKIKSIIYDECLTRLRYEWQLNPF